MSSDIRALAYSESPTLSGAIALMAKRRNDLEAAVRAAGNEPRPVATQGAVERRALEAITPAPATRQLLDVVA